MINTYLLKRRCKEQKKKIKDLAVPLKIKPTTAYQKLSGLRPIKLSEALIIQKELSIPNNEFRDYFMLDTPIQRKEA